MSRFISLLAMRSNSRHLYEISRYQNIWTTVQSLYGEVNQYEGWDERKVVEFGDINELVLKVRPLSHIGYIID